MESKLPCTKSRCECDCVCVYVYGYQQKDSQRIPNTHCKKVENIKCGMNFVETLRGTLFRSAFPISLPLAVCVCYRRFRFCLFFAVSLSLFLASAAALCQHYAYFIAHFIFPNICTMFVNRFAYMYVYYT